MRHLWLILAIPSLALLTGCGDADDEQPHQMLTADEVEQLDHAAEMLDVSNAPTSPSNILTPEKRQ